MASECEYFWVHSSFCAALDIDTIFKYLCTYSIIIEMDATSN